MKQPLAGHGVRGAQTLGEASDERSRQLLELAEDGGGDGLLGRPGEAVRAQPAVTRRTTAKRLAQAELTYQRAVAVTDEAVETRRRAPRRSRSPVGEVASILEEDPDLAEGLSLEERRVASRLFRAHVLVAEGPRWTPPRLDERKAFGLLVLEGLLGRRVRVGEARSMELLSCGDILRPWEEPCVWNLVPPQLEWRVFRPTRLAVLDERITRLIGQRPELVVAFSGRLLRRARCAEYLTAVGNFRHVEHRLLATLWHLASNWGYVTPNGVCMPFELTHEVLGEIVGARRPSVTTAMQRLARRGELAPHSAGGYLLTGDPAGVVGPDELVGSSQ